MNKLTYSQKIYTKESNIPGAGSGVFAKVGIKKGEIIEEAQLIEIPKNDTSLDHSFLITYFFYFGKDKERIALALGFGSLYNHSDTPNAVFKIKDKDKMIEFKALKNIEKDSEIYINYRRLDQNTKYPLWFE